MSSPRPLRGIVPVIVIVVLVAAATSAALWVLGDRPIGTTIVELVAIDQDHAVIVRKVEGDARRSFMEVAHATHGKRWGALISAYPSLGGGRTAIGLTDGVIAIRTAPGGKPDVLAFSGQGAKLGRVSPLGQRSDEGGFFVPGITSVAGRGLSYEVYGQPGRAATLVAIDLRIGRELWRAELGPGALGPMWLRERWLIVRQGPTLRFYDRVTGAGATVDIGGHPCVTDDAVYVSRTDGLRAIALDDLAERALATDWGAGGPPLLFGPCGRRGDSLVLLVGARGGRGSRADPDALAGRAGIAAEVVGVDAQTGALRWRAPLGPADLPSVVEGAAQRLYPDMLPLAGPLPPRVPIHLISQARGGAGTRVAMVDVDAGQVAWQLRRGRTAVDITLVREGARSYYYEPQTRILATLSGDTGAIEHAIRLVGAGPVWPMQVIGDRVWLYGGAGWAVLDARTFEIVGNRGPPLSFEDASGDLRPL